MGYIYRVTNLINGKRYIGLTKCDDVTKRWNKHKQVDRRWIGPYLHSAYVKHGIKNFKFEVVCMCFDEDCERYEKEYILKFNTLAPNGYNINLGKSISKHSEETKEKIRQTIIEYNKNNKRTEKRVISELQKEKLSISHKTYWNNLSDEKYKEICDKRKRGYQKAYAVNRDNSGLALGVKALRKGVGKYDLSGNLLDIYDSILAAATKNNLSHPSISKVCRQVKGYHTAGGFKWKFL